MNETCTCSAEIWAVTGPGYTFAFYMTIAYPIAIFMFLCIFMRYRMSFVFLRKRSLDVIFVSAFGCMILWSCTALFDVIGADKYPCWLFGLLAYSCVPIVATALLIKAFRYINEVSAIRLRNNRGNLQQDAANITLAQGFASHLRLLWRRGNERDVIRNARFTSSPALLAMWAAICNIPYVIMYIVRLTQSSWVCGCYGCDLSTSDAAFLLGMYSFGVVAYILFMPIRISRRDALRIKRESAMAYLGMGFFVCLAMILFLTDPGAAYVHSRFNFRIISLFGGLLAMYIQTVHQVLIAKRIKHDVIQSPNFNREDLFLDVRRDKHLNRRLRMFLENELSGEILNFLDRVDDFKRDFEREGRNLRARQIYDEFIIQRAPHEVNLSYGTKQDVTNRIMTGHIDFNIFDDAYAEVRDALLKDGFTRFSNSLKASDFSSAARVPQNSSATAVNIV